MRYLNPPIAEIVCEIAFRQGAEAWDPTVFGGFRHEIGEELRQRETLQILKTEVCVEQGQIGNRVTQSPRMRFWSADRRRVAQVEENALIANVLAPYPHWAEVEAFVLRCLRAYRTAARPSGAERAVLRYLDHIEALPAEGFALGRWFACGGAFLPACVAAADVPALVRVRCPGPGGDTLDLALSLEKAKDGTRTAKLDSAMTRLAPPLDEEPLKPVLRALHDELVRVFEGCILDPLRDRFGRSKS